jgi:hypothetical protein
LTANVHSAWANHNAGACGQNGESLTLPWVGGGGGGGLGCSSSLSAMFKRKGHQCSDRGYK